MSNGPSIFADRTLSDRLRDGLDRPNGKSIPSEYCYTDTGSKLFQSLCKHSDYYLSRVERQLLADNVELLFGIFEGKGILELGSGDCSKMSELVALSKGLYSKFDFYPNDINSTILAEGAVSLKRNNFKGIVTPINASYFDALGIFRKRRKNGGAHAVLFLGSTIGNFSDDGRAEFMQKVHASLLPGDIFLVACDLFKDMGKISDAYNGSGKIVQQVECESLRNLNALYDGDFHPSSFTHYCCFNPNSMYLESRLFSLCEQEIALETLGLKVRFEAGESILMDRMWKPTLPQFLSSIRQGGFEVRNVILDKECPYALVMGEVPDGAS